MAGCGTTLLPGQGMAPVLFIRYRVYIDSRERCFRSDSGMAGWVIARVNRVYSIPQ